jgi:hypothetical protein
MTIQLRGNRQKRLDSVEEQQRIEAQNLKVLGVSAESLSKTFVEQWMRRLPESNADHATFDELRRASTRVTRLREELAEAEQRLVAARRDAAAYLLRNWSRDEVIEAASR